MTPTKHTSHKGTIHSGGADGADKYFGDIGCQYGYQVIHHSFENHITHGNGTIIRHSQEELDQAIHSIIIANQTLQRIFPSNKHEQNLIKRDYFQVIHSDYVIAIAPFEKANIISEGTGWTVQMAVNAGKTIYVFDDKQTCKWYISTNEGSFTLFDGLVPNTGVFAGIGSRTLSDKGIAEIKKILSE